MEESETAVRAGPQENGDVADRRRRPRGRRVGIVARVAGAYEGGAEGRGTCRRAGRDRTGEPAVRANNRDRRGRERAGRVLGRRVPQPEARPVAGRGEKSEFGNAAERIGNRTGRAEDGAGADEHHDKRTLAVDGKTREFRAATADGGARIRYNRLIYAHNVSVSRFR